MAGPLPYRAAVRHALYGPAGFYRRPEGPAGHFRTSVHASPLLLAEALARLARAAGLRRVVDIGAGRGELLLALAEADPGLALHGVDVAPRPDGLPGQVRWSFRPPRGGTALLLGHEWLDDVPVDVVERTPGGVRTVLVDPRSGAETPGPPPSPADRAWLRRWWPLREVGDRAEVGRPRDRAWAAAVGTLRGGLAVAVDYAHLRVERAAGAYAAGTLRGHRDGRLVPPVPDGSCDVTAAVAMDAVAAAGLAAGARAYVLATQRAVLGHLLPEPVDGGFAALERRARVAELRDPDGLGGFCWLVQAVGGFALPGPLDGVPGARGTNV
ncbi:SAM-dependent methyltransferase [Motilibacter aurantiacus]|uniref:SAM-dependent methyltransferase n=1 Tax=Motilibacter aurantiacus TaxID=2714955 RepID=UPI002F2B444F